MTFLIAELSARDKREAIRLGPVPVRIRNILDSGILTDGVAELEHSVVLRKRFLKFSDSGVDLGDGASKTIMIFVHLFNKTIDIN